VKYETNCAERGVRVMQALMFVMIIAQTMCTKITAVAGKGRFEMATREQAKSAEKEASNCAAATSVQKEKTENREQTEANFAAAMGVQTKQTENTGQTKAVKVEVATSVQKEQTENREQTDVANVAAATTNMGQAEQTQQVRQARLEQAANVAEKWKTAANENEMGRAHANGTGRNAASREPAVMKRSTRSGWPSVTAAAFTTIVLIIMMSTTAGATEHGLTQRMMRVRQEMEWDRERDRTQMKPIWQTASDKVDKIDTIMRTVDLFEMEVQKWQEMESGRVRRIKDKDNIDFVTKVGELQQTMNRLGELKRRDCRVHHTDASEAQHIRDDKAEATLHILDELNLNMRSKIQRQGASVNLVRQILLMRRMMKIRAPGKATSRVGTRWRRDVYVRSEGVSDLLRGGHAACCSILSSGDSVRIYAYVAMGVRQKCLWRSKSCGSCSSGSSSSSNNRSGTSGSITRSSSSSSSSGSSSSSSSGGSISSSRSSSSGSNR